MQKPIPIQRQSVEAIAEIKSRALTMYMTMPVVSMALISKTVGYDKEQLIAWRDQELWLDQRRMYIENQKAAKQSKLDVIKEGAGDLTISPLRTLRLCDEFIRQTYEEFTERESLRDPNTGHRVQGAPIGYKQVAQESRMQTISVLVKLADVRLKMLKELGLVEHDA